MATVPAPRTWAVGELLTAAKLNSDLRDGLNFLLAPPLAILKSTSPTNIAENTFVRIDFQAEDIDRDGGHSTVTNITRYTCQTAGYYLVMGGYQWSSTYTTGARRMELLKNGTGVYFGVSGPPVGNTSHVFAQRLSMLLYLAVADYVELSGYHIGQASTLTASNADLQLCWKST